MENLCGFLRVIPFIVRVKGKTDRALSTFYIVAFCQSLSYRLLAGGASTRTAKTVTTTDHGRCARFHRAPAGSFRFHGGKLSIAIAALQELVKASNAQDEFFVVNFNDDPYMDEDFTSDPKSIFEALGKMDARSGTAINDAVLASADHLQEGASIKRESSFW
jgi:hypothetical protein